MTEQGREPMLYIATGMKGVGKSYRTLQEFKSYVMDNPKTGKVARKVLIFDTNNEYTNIPSVQFDCRIENMEEAAMHVMAYSETSTSTLPIERRIRRIVPFLPNGSAMGIPDKMRTAAILLKHFSKGNLLLEDLNNYALGAKSIEVISGITTNRHRDQDLTIHFQSLSGLDPRLFQNANIIRFHHQADPIKRIKHKVSNFELFEITKICVDTQYEKGNNRFFLYIHNNENFVSGLPVGPAGESVWKKACIDFAMKNRRHLDEFLNEVDGNGKRKHTYQSALNAFAESRLGTYIKR